MKLSSQYQNDFDALPLPLRQLLEAELAAGNEIVEVSHSFPAPPVGACFKLARPVSTRPRQSGDGIEFYDRNATTYSGEFTDTKRFFFILEPPRPPAPEPDMNALRAALAARQRTADAQLYEEQRNPPPGGRKDTYVEATPSPVPPRPAPPASNTPPTAVDRFRESMTIDYGKWHDGIGYDLSIIKDATPEELVEIENLLVNRSVDDWRDVEALAALNSPRAHVLLKKAFRNGNHQIRTAVTEYAPELFSETERTEALISALRGSDVYGGLTQALLQAETFHPPAVIDALFNGVLTRKGDIAIHFAALLMFLHGKASAAFDMDQRPFFLKFNTDDGTARQRMFRELCEKCAVDPAPYLVGK